MKSLPLRLSAVPAAAGLTVLLLSGISLVEMKEGRETDGDEDKLQILERPKRENLIPRSSSVPKLSEEEAVRLLSERPGRLVADIDIDLPRPRHITDLASPRFAALTLEVRHHLGASSPAVAEIQSS